MVARRAHNPKVTGSSPVPATKEEKSSAMATFFVLRKLIGSTFILRYYFSALNPGLRQMGTISFIANNILDSKTQIKAGAVGSPQFDT